MRQITKLLVPTLAAAILLAACGSSSSTSTATSAPAASQTSHAAALVVSTASNSTLGATILVNAHGMTLYHLSGEQNGKWICTSTACVQAWHPVTVPTSVAPKSSVGSLGTVKRPDGTIQVTYKGMPLYTFAQDVKAGEAKGQGIKDVGTWTAVTTGAAASSSPPATTSSTSSGGGGYAY